MKHALIAVMIVLLLSLVGGAYYVISNLDRLVADAIEYYGTQATGTAVKVGGVDVSLSEGRATIEGLTVANPEGFQYEYAFSLGAIAVDIDAGSLTGEPYGIELIDVNRPEIFFEVREDGSDNLRAIKDNVASSSEEAPAESGRPSPSLAIGRIALAEASLHARIVPMNEQRDVVIAPFAMTDLEGQPPEIARQVIRRLLDAALARVRSEGMSRLRDKAEDKAAEKLKDRLGL